MNQVIENFAAIDIGTNSFHLIVVKVKPSGNFEIIDREKEVIRLGEGSSNDIKEIRPEAISRAIACLKRFKGIADSHGARLRAVATSAVRESMNKFEFQEIVLEKTGVDIEIVSGIEEARLIYLGLLKAVPVFSDRVFCIDIGGGSTEFTIAEKGKCLHSMSLKIGAVRLTQKFFPDFVIDEDSIELAEKWVEGILFPVLRHVKKLGFDVSVGSSGTVMSTALMILAMKEHKDIKNTILNNVTFTAKELKQIKEEVLSKKTIEERLKIPGLDSNRADIIPAGVIILSKIFEYFGIEKMTVSGYALREGIVIDTLNKINPEEGKPNLHEIRFDSVKNLMDSCRYDSSHCEHVAKLSTSLYDQLTEIHNLDSDCREYLEAAALLHDIGYHIAHNQHHRHSLYLIKNSELLGFNEREISIIANVARYHRKSHPKESHKDFSALTEKSKEKVRKLSSIIRIADALDRTHKSVIEGIEVEMSDHQLKLNLIKNGKDADIEIWNFERRKLLFEKIFNRKILISDE